MPSTCLVISNTAAACSMECSDTSRVWDACCVAVTPWRLCIVTPWERGSVSRWSPVGCLAACWLPAPLDFLTEPWSVVGDGSSSLPHAAGRSTELPCSTGRSVEDIPQTDRGSGVGLGLGPTPSPHPRHTGWSGSARWRDALCPLHNQWASASGSPGRRRRDCGSVHIS